MKSLVLFLFLEFLILPIFCVLGVEAALVPLDPHGRKSFMTTPSDRIGSRA
jgi:hypothetical protein